ncbi:MAG: L,D-transpeptidase [Actinobacteria bacterium]|nr:L,D-transpeptidase [Actinomycetota bacterium]
MALTAAAPGAGAATAAGASDKPAVSSTQELVALTTSHGVRSPLGAHAKKGATLSAWRPITGAQTVLPVVGRATAADGRRWLRVLLPGRPNSAKGWIAQPGTRPASTTWHIVVRTASRQVRVYRHGALVRSFAAVVGKPSTPTPHGRFFVEESIRMPNGHPGAPYALALSARSNVLQEFDGGPGQIALHGIANLGGTPGTAVSHGCVRLANANISWLAARIVSGTPVTITR